jgi:alkanesulfonate monooxygenase SsuD/methylene tetrahydromethanopterin reductase-like flavin-dependent oxidoreductase (luciferase family)
MPLTPVAIAAGRVGSAWGGVLLLPLYHPLAVAEEAAMVDVISGGRLILGVGAGYAPEEFAAFGVSIKERGSRMDEAVPLIHRLWSEEKVTHQGRHYRVTEATVGPRPVQRPRPPIWFAGWVEPAIRRAGRLGDAWLGGPSARLDELTACVRLYRDARQAAGRDPDAGDVALMRYIFVAESLERAQAIAGAAFIQSFEATYFRWPHPVVKRPAGTLTIERLAEDRLILGDPASCIGQIQRFRQTLGLTHLVCRISAPGIPRDAARASLELFTREVMPAVL